MRISGSIDLIYLSLLFSLPCFYFISLSLSICSIMWPQEFVSCFCRLTETRAHLQGKPYFSFFLPSVQYVRTYYVRIDERTVAPGKMVVNHVTVCFNLPRSLRVRTKTNFLLQFRFGHNAQTSNIICVRKHTVLL